jgi:FKBP-type peptidyl-prolyl cis-trans isomerase FklB
MRSSLACAFACLVMFSSLELQAQTDSGVDPTSHEGGSDLIVSYEIAWRIGDSLRSGGGAFEIEAAVDGFRDGLSGRQSKVTSSPRKTALDSALNAWREKQLKIVEANAIELRAQERAFLESNSKLEGVKVLASGVQYQVVVSGTGVRPKPGSNVVIEYHAQLLDGKVLESSERDGGPVALRTVFLPAGVKDVIELMKTGDRYRIVLPSDLPGGRNRRLVIWEITLISVGE